MSDIGVSFDIRYAPNPCDLDVVVSTQGSDVYITLQNVPTLAVSATPNFSGNILVSAISVVLTPIANSVTLALGLFAGQIMNGKTYRIFAIDPVPFNIEGVSGRLTPKNLKLGNKDGNLMITGDFDM